MLICGIVSDSGVVVWLCGAVMCWCGCSWCDVAVMMLCSHCSFVLCCIVICGAMWWWNVTHVVLVMWVVVLYIVNVPWCYEFVNTWCDLWCFDVMWYNNRSLVLWCYSCECRGGGAMVMWFAVCCCDVMTGVEVMRLIDAYVSVMFSGLTVRSSSHLMMTVWKLVCGVNLQLMC